MVIRNPFRLDDDHPFTGWHMLGVIGLFFGVIIAVNIGLAIAATGTFPGLVVNNSYVASQGYNDLLEEARAQADEGMQMQLDAPDGFVVVRLLDRDGVLQRRLRVTAVVGRPSTRSEDRTIVLAPAAGIHRAEVALPPGQWIVGVEAWRGEQLAYRQQRRLYVRPDGVK